VLQPSCSPCRTGNHNNSHTHPRQTDSQRETTPVSSNENGPCTLSIRHPRYAFTRPEQSLPRSLWKSSSTCAFRKMPAPVGPTRGYASRKNFRSRTRPPCRKVLMCDSRWHAALKQLLFVPPLNGTIHRSHARLFRSRRHHAANSSGVPVVPRDRFSHREHCLRS